MATNSDFFDLTNWKLTLPIADTDGDALEIKNLIDYENSEYFYDAPDGAMVFRSTVTGSQTANTKYTRSELREMDGSDRAAWTLKEGGTMTATLKIDEMPFHNDGQTGRIIVGQIHGGNDELVRLYYEKGTLYFMNERAGPYDKELRFDILNGKGEKPDVVLGEKFSYMIDAHGDQLTVKVFADGQVYQSVTTINDAWDGNEFYFKAGVYLGVNDIDGHSKQGYGAGQVSFYGLDFGHTEGEGLDGWRVGMEHEAVTRGTNGDDVLLGADQVDIMVGYDGDDTIRGGEGDDRLYGQGGNDVLKGDGGDDHVRGGAGDDTLYGLSGDDRLVGDAGSDRLAGGDGADKLYGGRDADYLYGQDGNDYLFGGVGDDYLRGGLGSDRMNGGAGADKFAIFGEDVGGGYDSIYGFSMEEGDRLFIKDILENYDPIDGAIGDFLKLTDTGTNTYLSVDADGQANGTDFEILVRFSGSTDMGSLDDLMANKVITVD